MNKTVLFLALLLFLFACKRKLTPSELQTELKKAMLNYLQNQQGYDSSTIRFDVMDVSYFEDVKVYDCEFKVKLTQNGHDTTGIMTSTISKDFSKVKRKI
jgi:nitrate/nitrite-specific signal transduction histidine kinase